MFAAVAFATAAWGDPARPAPQFSRPAAAFAKDIALGINIGNTLDCPSGNETEWGNRPVTRELARLYKSKGISAVRLPVTWRRQFSVDDPKHAIRPEFMDRVQKAVDTCLAEGLTVILNIHHDGGSAGWPEEWLTIDGVHEDKVEKILCDIWRQIATRFRDYGEALVFEAFNEIRKAKSHPGEDGRQAGMDDWSGKPSYCKTVNRYAAAFYRTVRSTGGNNKRRYLLIPTYAATDYEASCLEWRHPMPGDDHVMVDVHAYEPGWFCLWGDKADYDRDEFAKRLEEVFGMLKRVFIDKGVPVVIGEVNAERRYHGGDKSRPNDADRAKWAEAYGRVAGRYACPVFLWENGGRESMGLVDRANNQWTHPEIVDAMISGIRAGRLSPYDPVSPDGGFAAPHQTPTLWADVPDMAICRKGGKYYMVSTTMHYNPGIPVMVSTDLVDWRVAGYCYETIESRSRDRLEGGESDYGLGTYASSIRYNPDDGYFYVISINPGVGDTYLFRTRNPEATPWEFHRLKGGQYDASLWFEDGRMYVYASVPGERYKVRLSEIKRDLSGFVDGGEIVLEDVNDCLPGAGLGEGTQVFKRNGWFYIVNISWGKTGRAAVLHRSRTMRGPWEGKVVFQFQGIAQGSFLETPDGRWMAYFFGDRGAVGRCPYMHEVEWIDDWPVVSTRNLPRRKGKPSIVESDSFDGPAPKKEWQWNHNPEPSLWSMKERPGWLRFRTDRVDGDLSRARNTLTQRCWGPRCTATTRVDAGGMRDGDRAGIALFQRDYVAAGVTKEGGRAHVVLWTAAEGGDGTEKARVELPRGAMVVWLRAKGDFRRKRDNPYWGNPPGVDEGRMEYSLDGREWTALGGAHKLNYTAPHFTGYRFGLFMYSTKTPGGRADFDFMEFK